MNPDFIKIDVEGSELKVFRGASKLIERYKPIIVHEGEAGNKNFMLPDLKRSGYLNFYFEHMSECVDSGFNYLSLPSHCLGSIDVFMKTWKELMEELK